MTIKKLPNLHEAAMDLYRACRAALGAYESLKLIGADEHLPGYEHCLRDLEAAIAKVEGHES